MAFKKLKEVITSPLVLALPSLDKIFVVKTDALATGIRVVLLQ